jgi:hypothetical protein
MRKLEKKEEMAEQNMHRTFQKNNQEEKETNKRHKKCCFKLRRF